MGRLNEVCSSLELSNRDVVKLLGRICTYLPLNMNKPSGEGKEGWEKKNQNQTFTVNLAMEIKCLQITQSFEVQIARPYAVSDLLLQSL